MGVGGVGRVVGAKGVGREGGSGGVSGCGRDISGHD